MKISSAGNRARHRRLARHRRSDRAAARRDRRDGPLRRAHYGRGQQVAASITESGGLPFRWSSTSPAPEFASASRS